MIRPMRRLFNVAGPNDPRRHYTVPAAARLPELRRLLEDGLYVVLHAARQSGKTTLIKDLCRIIEAAGAFHALYATVETVRGAQSQDEAIELILIAIAQDVDLTPGLAGQDWRDRTAPAGSRLQSSLGNLARLSDRPIILLLDEADGMEDTLLLSVLSQLRAGYVNRNKAPFIHGLALVGLRNLRDYRARIRPDGASTGVFSPFNIVTKSVTIGRFGRDDITALYAQHTADTGQAFPADVVDLVWAQTRGQPWLVNAIGREITDELLDRDHTRLITAELAATAIQNIILRRDTHIDNLLERLKEPRVRRVVEPILVGEGLDIDWADDDAQHVVHLGLIDRIGGEWTAACPIYREVIVRALSLRFAEALPATLRNRWLSPAGIDVDGLLREFQQWWREHGDLWASKSEYHEFACHLVLMGYLQRIVNGGAQVDREFATGRRRLDLNLRYAGRHHPIEIKLRYSPKAVADGLVQTADYCNTLGSPDGWLVVFDRAGQRTWDERLTWDEVVQAGVRVRVVGC